jgi:hypothetical protein
MSGVTWVTFTEKFAVAGVNTSGERAGVPVPVFVPLTRVQVEEAVPVASVLGVAGLKELPAVLVAKFTGIPLIPAWLFRVVALTVTGAVIVVLLSGISCGDDGPVLELLSWMSTTAKGLKVLTVVPTPPPVAAAASS